MTALLTSGNRARRRSRIIATAAATSTACGLLATAAAAPASAARLVPIGSFDQPIHVTAPPGDRSRLFVAEKRGRIRLVVSGKVRKRPFLDLSRKVSSGNEQGLLGLAFSPRFSQNRRFYVHYTNRAGDTRIVEYRTRRNAPRTADPRSARVLFGTDQPSTNHNGGHLAFGPDGLLYTSLGDGGGAGDPDNNAQDLTSPLGKILAIPLAKRPVAAGEVRLPRRSFTGPARPLIAAYGLRNPWRFSFDRTSGRMIIGDVGQNEWEEIDVRPANARGPVNYGWRPFEGPVRYTGGAAPGHVMPALSLSHDSGFCSVTGGVVVRDPAISDLAGRYVYGDFCNSEIRSALVSDDALTDDRPTGLSMTSVVSFGEDGRGRVYVVSINGQVSRIA